MDQELTSMKLTKGERKESSEICCSQPGETSGPTYPWGLGVTLERESLNKMGIKISEHAVGDEVELYARCKITRLSQSEREGEKNPNRTMELQITDMCLEKCEPGDKEKNEGGEDSLGWEDDTRSMKVEGTLKKRY